MENELLVLDIETTGFDHKKDSIVEIGAVILNTKNGEISNAFHALIKEPHFNPSRYGWIFENSSLNKIDVVQKGKSLEEVRSALQDLLNEHIVTAYNSSFDFGFLRDRKFKINKTAADPMQIATGILKIHHSYYGVKFPKVQECLDYFGIKEIEPHRADRDAFLEAKIIWELMKIGKYPKYTHDVCKNFEPIGEEEDAEDEYDEEDNEDEFGCPDNGDDCEFCPEYEGCEHAS